MTKQRQTEYRVSSGALWEEGSVIFNQDMVGGSRQTRKMREHGDFP